MDLDKLNILVVWVPSDDIDKLRSLRDFVLDSLERGVLVLPADSEVEIITVPKLNGVAVCGCTMDAPMELLLENEHSSQSISDEVEAAYKPCSAAAEEKRAIAQRLKNYRTLNGLGCFAAVVKASRSRGKITEDILRAVVSDRPPQMDITDWRKIGKALDRLEQEAEPNA